MQREDSPFARTTLRHREMTAAESVHYLSFRGSAPHLQRDDGPPLQTFSDLFAAALSWLFNEIVEGLAAYGHAIHPIIPPVSVGTLAGHEAADQISNEHRANSQSDEAEGPRAPHVTLMMAHSNASVSLRAGRGSR
jgi:hypothetical protein